MRPNGYIGRDGMGVRKMGVFYKWGMGIISTLYRGGMGIISMDVCYKSGMGITSILYVQGWNG